ncbi:MAG TPA: ATP-binding protein, partial [Thermoanaerobaculia bacterium]|nr:ATP-binding protein [Thermoanaerobaculia bacterium]
MPVYVALTLAAFAGNYFSYPLFFGLEFLFGSIFALLVVQLYGPLWGTAAAAIAASYTFFIWGHPWAAVILTAEALVVGLLAPRLKQNLLLADGLFWLLLGAPLGAFFYGVVLQSGTTAMTLVVLKQCVNGICNALVASLLLTHTPIGRLAGAGERQTVPLRQMVFELLVAAVLVPMLALVALSTRQDLRKLESDLRGQLDQTAASLASRIGSWRDRHLNAIVELARSAGERGLEPAALQPEVELVHRMFPELASVYVADGAGVITAVAPATDAAGVPQAGISMAGRPWLAAARDKLRPVVTSVFRGALGRREPVVAIAAPVVRGNVAAAVAVGALDLKQLRGLLQLYAPSQEAQLTLTDADGVVIASTVPGMLPLSSYRVEGEVRPLGDGRYQRFGEPPGEPPINRWRSSVYGHEIAVGSPPWRLRVELPVAPLQQFLQERYLQAFGALLALCLLSLLASAAVSGLLARSLARLAAATTGLPERLASGEPPAWPRSRVAEVDSLARNFRRMAVALEDRFQELTSTGAALADRSVELAAANRELESEVAERRRAEWALRLLAESGSALASSLEPQPTLDRIARGCIPGLADWSVALLDRGGVPLLSVAHRVEADEARLRELATAAGPLVVDGDSLEQPLLLTEPLGSTVAGGAGLGALLRAVGGTSALLLPLRARGKTLGALVLARGGADGFDRQASNLAEELARRAALALDNAALYAELREADRRKDEFLAMLAHELRNPLSPVATSLQLLRIAGDDRERSERALAIMERQIGHIVRLVDDLLDVARITRGRIELRLQPLDLRSVVSHAVDNVRPRFDERGQKLHVELPAEAVPVRADATRLDQVVVNLLANANKYTPPGGHVSVKVERRGERAVLRVRDDGIGLPPDLLGRVFDLFMQSAQALDRSQGGLGIGLTLVRQLVEMHGGKVTARSDGEGKGSEFEVQLPLHAAAPVVAPAERPKQLVELPARQVLVVDDNVEGAESLAELLRLWGHTVRVAHDGPSGLALAAEECPEVVLLDIGLPGLDGYEVGRRLRAEEST